jgi:protein pelota
VVIASPGFTKDGFFSYLKAQSELPLHQKGGTGGFLKHCVEKSIVAHSSSGYKHSLQEVLQNRAVQERIKDLAVFEEALSLEKFFEALAMDSDKVCYGQKSVTYALDNHAVDTLLVSDKLFRAKNLATRKLYVSIVERAERDGVTTMVFSSMNPSGERLDSLCGIAALLRYPMPGIDDIEEDDVDIDELINQEEEVKREESEEEEVKGGSVQRKNREWDEEQLY